MSEYQGMDKSRMKLDSDHGWKWKPTHVHSMAAGISFVHLLCAFAPSTFTWPAFWSAVGMHILTGLLYRDRKNVEDLKKQAFYRFLERTYYWHPFTLWILLYAFGGFPFLVWVAGVRSVFGYHVTFLGTSVVHIWGKQAWNTSDLSKNNWLVACFTFGEGWHNNHHAFEYSARQGLEWWQFDPTWYAIRFLEAIGLATNVKLPTETQKRKKSF